jgi:hypothetical protein
MPHTVVLVPGEHRVLLFHLPFHLIQPLLKSSGLKMSCSITKSPTDLPRNSVSIGIEVVVIITWCSWQAIRSIEIQRLRGVATTARALCDVHVTVLKVVATAVVSDRMRSHTKKLPRIISAHHSGCHKPLRMPQTTWDPTHHSRWYKSRHAYVHTVLLPSISCDSD